MSGQKIALVEGDGRATPAHCDPQTLEAFTNDTAKFNWIFTGLPAAIMAVRLKVPPLAQSLFIKVSLIQFCLFTRAKDYIPISTRMAVNRGTTIFPLKGGERFFLYELPNSIHGI
jgi:hypothetical protein